MKNNKNSRNDEIIDKKEEETLYNKDNTNLDDNNTNDNNENIFQNNNDKIKNDFIKEKKYINEIKENFNDNKDSLNSKIILINNNKNEENFLHESNVNENEQNNNNYINKYDNNKNEKENGHINKYNEKKNIHGNKINDTNKLVIGNNNREISEYKSKAKTIMKNESQNLFNIKNQNKKIIIDSRDKISTKSHTCGKTYNPILRNKDLLSESKSKYSKSRKSKFLKKSLLLPYTDRVFPVIDKEGILVEILHSKNDIESIDKELLKLKKQRRKLKQKNLANQLIMERILNIEGNNSKNIKETDSILETEVENDNSNTKIDYENSAKKMSESKNDTFSKSRNLFFIKNNSKEIVYLKKLILNCDRNIEDKDKLMNLKKNNDKINNFFKLNSSIDKQNKNLEELVNKSLNLQCQVLDNDTKIEFFTVKIKNYIDSTCKLKEELDKNNVRLGIKERELQNLCNQKEEIIKRIKILEEEDKNLTQINEQKKEEKKIVENELKTSDDIKKEKNKDEQQFEDIVKKENILKMSIGKNERKILELNKFIKYHQSRIIDYLNERESLIDKSKLPKYSRERKIFLENNIKKIKNEYEENKRKINDHDKIKKQLINKINHLTDELKKKKDKNTEIAKKYDEIKKEYITKVPKKDRKIVFEEEKKTKKKGCIIF